MNEPATLSADAIVAAVRRLDLDGQLDVYLAIREALPDEILGPVNGADTDLVPTEEFRRELEARYARYQADPGSAISLEALDEELKARFGDD